MSADAPDRGTPARKTPRALERGEAEPAVLLRLTESELIDLLADRAATTASERVIAHENRSRARWGIIWSIVGAGALAAIVSTGAQAINRETSRTFASYVDTLEAMRAEVRAHVTLASLASVGILLEGNEATDDSKLREQLSVLSRNLEQAVQLADHPMFVPAIGPVMKSLIDIPDAGEEVLRLDSLFGVRLDQDVLLAVRLSDFLGRRGTDALPRRLDLIDRARDRAAMLETNNYPEVPLFWNVVRAALGDERPSPAEVEAFEGRVSDLNAVDEPLFWDRLADLRRDNPTTAEDVMRAFPWMRDGLARRDIARSEGG